MTKASLKTIILLISKNNIDRDLEKAFTETYDKLINLFNGQEGRPNHGAPIAALQFAATYQSEEKYHIRTLSIAHDDYSKILRDFLLEQGSILFSKSKVDKTKADEACSSLNGTEKSISSTKPKPDELTPPKGSEEVGDTCNFETWNNYLSEMDFGKYSIWLSLVDKSQEKWRFSIDFFLILNIDISAHVIDEKTLIADHRPENFKKWKFKYDLFEILYNFANDFGIGVITKSLNEALNKQAVRSAISQVMARNMSHNIGSHVLSRMVNVDAIKKFIDAPLALSSKSTLNNQYNGFLSNNEFASDAVRLIATFNSYLKSRMDFLADVTTGVPTVENSKWFFKELLSGIDKNRLLLDRISGISNFHFKIIAKNSVNKKEEVFTITEQPKNNSTQAEGEKTKYEISNDLMVSIPNDILGCHALYIIIENIIRNCVKHGINRDEDKKGKCAENPLNICIEIKNCVESENNELYEVTIFDDGLITGEDSIEFNKEEKNKYENYTNKINGKITTNRLDKLVFDQNYRLNQSILKDGSLRKGSWGLIEMDASAAYLRKIPVEQIDQDSFNIDLRQTDYSKNSYYPEEEPPNSEIENFIKQPNILKAIAVNGRHLGYRLFLFKPREVLIIDDGNILDSIDINQRTELLNGGILLCDTNNSEKNFLFNSKKIYNHKLVVVISDKPEKIISKNQTGISERILRISVKNAQNQELLSLLPSKPRKFKEELWKTYIKSIPYDFYHRYFGLTYNNFCEEIVNKESKCEANYFDHGDGFEIEDYNDSDIKPKYKEIKYSAVEGFMPQKNDVIKFIQYVESIHNKIVIIDERIQEYAKHGKYSAIDGNEIKVSDIYESTNIYVPTDKVCDLGIQNFDLEYNKIFKFFEDHSDANFFVIHLGIIEKLIQSHNRREDVFHTFNKEKGIKEFLEETICNTYKIDYSRLVIISGRGIPHNLPSDTRYLNFSIISQYMIDLRFKYLLSEAIFSARKIKNN